MEEDHLSGSNQINNRVLFSAHTHTRGWIRENGCEWVVRAGP